MRLSNKHSNTQTVSFNNFSGGLNMSNSREMIGETELSECINMDVDTSNGLLKVVDGNKRIFTVPDGTSLQSIYYDKINKLWLVSDTAHKLYSIDLTIAAPVLSLLGTLTGTVYPVYASWESGVLVASGGQLQYYDGKTFTTLTNAPKASTAVYIAAGRVLVNDFTSGNESNIYWSSTGDETTWKDDTNDASSGKWLEVGYKDGGKIIAFVPMSSYIIVVKDNRHVYRVTGYFPNWSVDDVSRNVDCTSRLGFYAEGTSVYLFGAGRMQYLDTSQFYGDIKAADVGAKVSSKLQQVDNNPRMIYVAPLNQVWIPLVERYVLVYDCTAKTFYQRRFNRVGIVDVSCVGTDIYILRPDCICRVTSKYGYDDGVKMMWRFASRKMVSSHDFLLKRASVEITPWIETLMEGNFKAGGIMLPLPTPYTSYKIYGNKTPIYHNRHHICGENQREYLLYESGPEIYENYEPIYHNYEPIFHVSSVGLGERCVYRNKTIGVSGSGEGCCFILNSIHLDIAEV